MALMRWDIINHFIKKNNYKSYLEIGYYKGWSFDKVECKWKCAVDPNPCKVPSQEEWHKRSINWFENSGDGVICKMSSDEFFKNETQLTNFARSWGYELPEHKYDIIFIDGLHESQQVDRDIQNALRHLNEGGMIIMHDCNPEQELLTTTGINGCWTGDVYKSFCRYRSTHLNETYVVDTDYGVGIIKDKIVSYNEGFCAVTLPPLSWESFDKNRKQALNLISPEEFLEREK